MSYKKGIKDSLNVCAIVFSLVSGLWWLLSAQTKVEKLVSFNNYVAAGAAVLASICLGINFFISDTLIQKAVSEDGLKKDCAGKINKVQNNRTGKSPILTHDSKYSLSDDPMMRSNHLHQMRMSPDLRGMLLGSVMTVSVVLIIKKLKKRK